MQNTDTKKRDVSLYMEANPNPNSLKFVANHMLLPAGESFDFADAEIAEASPLATELFQHPAVERVFFMSNFVTVTKKQEIDWFEIKDEIRDTIKAYLESGRTLVTQPVSSPQEEQPAPSAEDSETVGKIKLILDEYIRPAVESDGGAIQFHSFNDGVVKVLLQGACSGCPSSTITLKAGIENLLKRMVPGVETVEAEGV